MARRQRNTKWGPNQLLAICIEESRSFNQDYMRVYLVGASEKIRYPRTAEHGYPGDVLVGSEEFRQMQNHLERVINGNVVVGYDVFAQLRKLGLNKIRYMEMSSLGKREQKLLAENEAHSIMKFALAKLNFNEDIKFSTYYHRTPMAVCFRPVNGNIGYRR